MPGLFKASNPALSENTFQGPIALGGEAMTLQGTVNKTGLLLFCVSATAAWTWWLSNTRKPARGDARGQAGSSLGLVRRSRQSSRRSGRPSPRRSTRSRKASLWAESPRRWKAYSGIAIQALGLTFGVTLVMLMLYTSRILRATRNSRWA